MDIIKHYRNFLKANFDDWDDVISDQQKQVPCPMLEKQAANPKLVIELPPVNEQTKTGVDITTAIMNRRSVRKYGKGRMTLDELSYLLYMTHGVKQVIRDGVATLRTVPSGGARHPFETYLAVLDVDGLQPGIYHYLGLSHSIELLFQIENLPEALGAGTLGQTFVGNGNVTFIWSAVPYRSEWRYHISAHKTLLLDAGHICQNLYLACEGLGYGTVAIAAYDQLLMDQLLRLDGEEEFVVYLAPVGKNPKSD